MFVGELIVMLGGVVSTVNATCSVLFQFPAVSLHANTAVQVSSFIEELV